jgi:hypothetical protein
MVYCGLVCEHSFTSSGASQKTGLCRLRRGEQLSAWRFVQGHAFTLLLELIEFESTDPMLDVFSKERRFEQRHPEWPAQLNRFLQGYDRASESAQEMLAYFDQNYPVHPDIKRVILNLCQTSQA